MERINDHFKQSPLIELLGHAAKFTVVVAIVSGAWTGIRWQLEADDRAKERDDRNRERQYRDWEQINTERGSTSFGARRAALQDLNKLGASLAGAPLELANLPGIDLKGADLSYANLQGANLLYANLAGANLAGAILKEAYLPGVDLKGAILKEANLQGALLADANLSGAFLAHANLENANLQGASLKEAHFWYANLQGADFLGANLEGATLVGAKLQSAIALTQKQLDSALGDELTALPEGIARPAHWEGLFLLPVSPGPNYWTWRRRSAADAPGSDK